MSDTRGEGCGIYPILVRKTKFYDACNWHDLAYLRKSWQQGHLSRKVVDKWFLGQMLRKAGGSRIARIQAHIFYGLSRLLGGFWWEGKR